MANSRGVAPHLHPRYETADYRLAAGGTGNVSPGWQDAQAWWSPRGAHYHRPRASESDVVDGGRGMVLRGSLLFQTRQPREGKLCERNRRADA